jgi:branched-chain amino acid transport system substrate-binding protein
MPDLEEDSDAGRWRKDWHARYKKRFNEEVSVQAQVAYVTADIMIRAMEAAGPELTTAKMVAELEKIRDYVDPFGGPTLSFGPEKHQGSDSIYLSQIIDGKWRVIQKNLPY